MHFFLKVCSYSICPSHLSFISAKQRSVRLQYSRLDAECGSAHGSLGKVSGDIPGISEGAAWLARAMAAKLYSEDIDVHWQGMQDYATPELLGDEWKPTELKALANTGQDQVA